MHALALTGRVTPDDGVGAAVLGLPFEVPAGTTRIDVAYRHDEGHVLDLGLADPGFRAFPAREGFRGWSGGARTHAFVATDEATPGYLPGPIPTGTWYVLLGLARVTGPCDYRIELTLSSDPRRTAPPFEPDLRVRAGPGWYAGDLQAHTDHSDARGSLDDLVAAAVARGLDFVAVTDHNTVSHHREIAARPAHGPLLIPGEEVTSYRGHANVWGARGWVDFRAHDDATMDEVVRQAHALGGLFSVNHPKAQPGCIGCDWQFAIPGDADAFEAWQGPWPLRNWESLARYDASLAAGRRPTLVGGSDRHQPARPDPDPPILQVGSPTTWIWAESLSVPGLLDGVRRGRVCVGEGPRGPRLDLSGPDTAMGGSLPTNGSCRVVAEVRGARGDSLRWVGPTGVVREVEIAADTFEDVWTVARPPTFLRAEVVAHDADLRAAACSAALDAAARAGREVGAMRRELAASLGRPWLRCLSNPLYGPGGPDRHALAAAHAESGGPTEEVMA